MIRYYTGVGHRARNVSKEGESFALWLSDEMAKRDIYLLSGDADGIDKHFETNCQDKCVIYLPYPSFGHYEGRNTDVRHCLTEDEKKYAEGQLFINGILPEIAVMPEGSKRFHLRNFFQAWNFDDLPEVCFYYAREDADGNIEGGTRTAVYTARFLGVPCYNFYTEEGREEIRNLLKSGEYL